MGRMRNGPYAQEKIAKVESEEG
eukprot:COSAG06_NODE_23910_length_678_cov_1.046632_2_plen_22_part_01